MTCMSAASNKAQRALPEVKECGTGTRKYISPAPMAEKKNRGKYSVTFPQAGNWNYLLNRTIRSCSATVTISRSHPGGTRSEERRGGKGGGSTCRYRWSP